MTPSEIRQLVENARAQRFRDPGRFIRELAEALTLTLSRLETAEIKNRKFRAALYRIWLLTGETAEVTTPTSTEIREAKRKTNPLMVALEEAGERLMQNLVGDMYGDGKP